ncbi:MAG: Pathogenicity locus [Candidatus Dependentiae bacterium]|nr:Pathogenicity locus [Candidatus Dependentiae bacterium]
MSDRLEEISGHKQNICMLHLFRAIVHEAQTGERRLWSYYSRLRREATEGK